MTKAKKKIYSVSIPVAAAVTVMVLADNEEEAEDLAAQVANVSGAEIIDYIHEDPDVIEVPRQEMIGARAYISRREFVTITEEGEDD